MAEENLTVLVELPPDHERTLTRLKFKISREGGKRASPASSSSNLQCPKVPEKLLREAIAKTYVVPKGMSLGPYHHGLAAGETLKLKLAEEFISECEWTVDEIYNSICNQVVELKGCYEKETAENFSDADFTEMMLVDGCALLEYIICVYFGDDLKDYDIRYQDLSLLHQDALLLENQLPYQLLQLLMKSMPLSSHDWAFIFLEFFGFIDESYFQDKPLLQRMKDSCSQLCLPVIPCIDGNPEPKPEEELNPASEKESKPKPDEEMQPKTEEESKPNSEKQLQPKPEEELKSKTEGESQPKPEEELKSKTEEESKPFHHLLDFYRNSFMGDAERFNGTRNNKIYLREGSQKKKRMSPDDIKYRLTASFRNVKELMASGIRIKPSPTRYLRDITFTTYGITACLRLNIITIDKSTKTLFFNLIAYEMSSDVPHDFISYLCFLDSLIDHADDVKELQSAGVLQNNLGTHEEVAAFFNTVSAKLDSNLHTYKDVREKIRKHLDRYYNSKLKRWMTQCLDTYFSGPWANITWIATALALFLTAVQTYFSAFPPGSNHAELSHHL